MYGYHESCGTYDAAPGRYRMSAGMLRIARANKHLPRARPFGEALAQMFGQIWRPDYPPKSLPRTSNVN
jgi:hypothetical protein